MRNVSFAFMTYIIYLHIRHVNFGISVLIHVPAKFSIHTLILKKGDLLWQQRVPMR